MSDLKTIATECLKGRPFAEAEKILLAQVVSHRKLLQALVHDYLERIAYGPGDQNQIAGDAANGGQNSVESQVTSAPVRRVIPQTSPEVRAANRKIAKAASDAIGEVFEARRINGKFLGDLLWYELGSIARQNLSSAAEQFQTGMRATENAILCRNLLDHTQPADDRMKVRDVMKARDLEKMLRDAERAAPKLIAMAASHHIANIEARKWESLL
jgi:hypothetical protein